jgi:lipopolysaccharide export LptBFGC system permease protein LptF
VNHLGRLLTLARQTGENESSAFLARVELYHRVAYPVAALALGLLAVPLGLAGKRFSRAAGGVVGLLVTVVYYGLMQLGERTVAGTSRFLPCWRVWLAQPCYRLLSRVS